MIYFLGLISGLLFLIFAALYGMYDMHVNYKKSIPNLKKFKRINPDGTVTTYYRSIPK